MNSVEYEIKILLTKKQYCHILSLFHWTAIKRQVNFYYDCKELRNDDRKPTIRIRGSYGKLQLQVKIPHTEDVGAVHIHDEYEKDISILPYSLSAEELNQLCGRTDMEEVHLIGMLVTDRHVDSSFPGLEIALDSNSYLGKKDYELELEYQEEIPADVLEKLSFLNIDFEVRTKGKYSRFVERYLAIEEKEITGEKKEGMVSVVVPVFNTEAYLHRCIDSILAQTYSNIEVIVIDDGSTDSSGKICDFYAGADSRVKVLHQENQGVSIARNHGIHQAAGEYILFVDSDDWMEPNMLETMFEKVKRDRRQLIVCNAFRDNNPSRKIMDLDIQEDEVLSFQELARCDRRGISVMDGPWGKLYNLNLIRENALEFDPQINFGEDRLFVFHYTCLVEETVCIAKPYYHYVYREESALNGELSERHFQIFKVYQILLSYFEESSERYEALRQACLNLVYWYKRRCASKESSRFLPRLEKLETALVEEKRLPVLEWEGQEDEGRTN
ncbi:MAG: glycosyltransferase [Lachnospiraceae bacterium]|nr:glycosyltransferase [Lachnospiraceae bacterium]